jgi:hypothetical protein
VVVQERVRLSVPSRAAARELRLEQLSARVLEPWAQQLVDVTKRSSNRKRSWVGTCKRVLQYGIARIARRERPPIVIQIPLIVDTMTTMTKVMTIGDGTTVGTATFALPSTTEFI